MLLWTGKQIVSEDRDIPTRAQEKKEQKVQKSLEMVVKWTSVIIRDSFNECFT